ncbi:MAG: methylmalonyl-CoA mutase subunit beta [Salegentibacter sp.]
MEENLFREFPEVSAEQWKQQIQRDLKGADYNEKLIYYSPDGIKVQPFYHSEELKENVLPPPPEKWFICEKIQVATAKEGNAKAKYVLEKGAESLWFLLSEEVDPAVLFDGIDLTELPIFIQLRFLSEKYYILLQHYLKNRESRVYLQTDIIGNLARTGNWYFDHQQDFYVLESMIERSSGFRAVVSIDASLYQNAGANIPHQLAFSLAHLNEYLNYMEGKTAKLGDFQPQFILASGGNYFFEIAKVRALRWLYANLAREYGLPETCHILAEPTRRDKTLYDYNVNLLRTTTESMSAILGGADAVCNMPYDTIFHKPNNFGERIARNQLLILKNEAYFDKVSNPADGSYYIENLTRQFAEAALEIFKEIEAGGGFLKQLEKGIIQQQIGESAAREQQLFDDGTLTLLGTNKFPNPEDQMEHQLEKEPFAQVLHNNRVIDPIREKRLSEKAEKERIQKERTILT